MLRALRASWTTRGLLRGFTTTQQKVLGGESKDLQQTLALLDQRLRTPALANADEVLGDLRDLHAQALVIPQTIYVDALRLFTGRKDVLRAELLLRLAQSNLAVFGAGFEQEGEKGSGRSRPQQDAFHKLVSFTVTGLLREGCVDDAMTLLVRMSNAGYVTSRISMEKMLDRVASSGKACPPMSFIDKVHQMVRENKWDGAPGYYAQLFRVFRQHILWSCPDLKAVDEALARMEVVWAQAEKGSSVNLELLSLRVQCFMVASRVLRPLSIAKASATMERAVKAFDELARSGNHVSSSSAAPPARASDLDEAMRKGVQTLVEEIRAKQNGWLSNIDAKDLFSIANQRNTKASTYTLNIKWTRPEANVRSATTDLFVELAQSGHLDDALTLLDVYLKRTAAKASQNNGGNNVSGKLEAALLRKKMLSARSRSALLKDRDDCHYLDHENWAHTLIGKMLVASGASLAKQEEGGGTFYDKLKVTASKLKEIAARHHLAPLDLLPAAMIEALAQQTGSGTWVYSWSKAHEMSLKIIDSLEDEVGRSPAVYQALVSMLCKFQDPSALAQAAKVFQEMTAESVKIPAESFATFLDCAVSVQTDDELAKTLGRTEELLLRSDELVRNPSVLHARLRAHARLCHGHKSLELLRSLRARLSESRLAGVDRHTYTWVINALYLAWPGSDAEWRIATEPGSTAEYLLREMLRDGHRANANTVSLLLKLYSKACQINKKRGAVDSILDSAEEFLTACRSGGFLGHPKVAISDACIRELVKACCLGGLEERALATIDKAEKTFGVRPSAACWEPLIYYYASKKGALTAAEDILTMMTNRGVSLTDAVTDAFVAGHLKQGDASEALDRLQDIYNQHNVRPAPGTLLNLLDFSLHNGDLFEAERVVGVIRQMYSDEERQNVTVQLPTTGRHLGVKYSIESRASQLGPDSRKSAKAGLDGGSVLNADSYRLRASSTRSGPAVLAALGDAHLKSMFAGRGDGSSKQLGNSDE